MKLHRKQYWHMRARLDRLTAIVALLWLATSLALLLSFRIASPQAAHPRKTMHHSVALFVPLAAARASSIGN
jgi:preprotein translocase subunit SecG